MNGMGVGVDNGVEGVAFGIGSEEGDNDSDSLCGSAKTVSIGWEPAGGAAVVGLFDTSGPFISHSCHYFCYHFYCRYYS